MFTEQPQKCVKKMTLFMIERRNPLCVKRTFPDSENHEQNGYAKVYDDNNLFMTNVDNDNSDTTYTDMRNM